MMLEADLDESRDHAESERSKGEIVIVPGHTSVSDAWRAGLKTASGVVSALLYVGDCIRWHAEQRR